MSGIIYFLYKCIFFVLYKLISVCFSRNFCFICYSIVENFFDLYKYFIFFLEEEGGMILLLIVIIFFYKEFLKWFNVLFLFLKIYYFLNKELLFVIKWRFEYLSFGMFVFNKYCIFLFVCKSKDIMFLSYLYILLKLVKFIFFLFWLLIYFFKYINNWIYVLF